MITKHEARTILDAFTWCSGDAFLNAMSKIYPLDTWKWGYYVEEQFEMMQQKPLDFIVKWPDVANQIVITYQQHQ